MGCEQAIKRFNYLENYLANKTWLTGEDLTLADYAVGGMTTYFSLTKFPYKRYPNISAWISRLSNNKAWQSTMLPIWGLGIDTN